MPETRVIECDGPAIELRVEALGRILADSVAAGASISFMTPLSYDDAAKFWLRDVHPEVSAGECAERQTASDDPATLEKPDPPLNMAHRVSGTSSESATCTIRKPTITDMPTKCSTRTA